MALVCKKCGYVQNDDQTIRIFRNKFPSSEEKDIPYYCGACLDEASDDEYNQMQEEMHPSLKQESKWKLTDDDSFQHVFHEGESRFALIEMHLLNPDTREYEVYSNYINVEDFTTGQNKNELLEIMDAFYESLDQFNRSYARCSETERQQIIAECIFEYKGSADGYSIFRGSEEECRDFIRKFIVA